MGTSTRWTAARARARDAVGTLSVGAYVAALIVTAIEHRIKGPALASSPRGVAAGKLVALLTSGVVVDGPAWPQIALLTAALIAALRRFGAVRLWTVAVSAHVGATLLAYTGIGLAWIVDPRLVAAVTRAPDFGISVVLTGELGALLAPARNHGVVSVGSVVLALPGVAAFALTGTVDTLVLASVEHSLGFWLGALVARARPTTRRSRRNPTDESRTPMMESAPQPATPRVPVSSALAIREYRSGDEQMVVTLALRAWAPVFASLEHVLGHEIFHRLHGDWRRYQASAVRETLANENMRVWVAETERNLVAFVAATLHSDRHIGEISMLAVEPEHQRHGVGSAVTEFATDWLRRAGMRVAMVETGGDAGHAAARRVYENAGYTPLPVIRYFKAL